MKNPTFIELEKVCDGLKAHRNFECHEYNECLTRAAFRNLDLHCVNCPLNTVNEVRILRDLEVAG